MKRFLVVFTLIAMSLAPCAVGQAQTPKKLVIYAAASDLEGNMVFKEFTKKTGIPTEAIMVSAAGTMASRVEAEKDAPRADIFMGGSSDFHVPLARKGLLVSYKSPAAAAAKMDPQFVDPNGYWHGWYLGAMSIMVNTERFDRDLAPRGVTKPATWDDLLRPEFRGQLILPSPITVGGGYIFVAGQIARLGEERAWTYLKNLAAGTLQFTPTATATITLLERGEGAVGVMWAHEGIAARLLRKQPIEVIVPPDTVTEIGAVSIIKGGPNVEGAKAFVDFLMTRTPQEIYVEYGFRYPVRPDVSVPKGAPSFASLKFAKYDRQWATENMARIKEQWVRTIGK